MGPFDDRVVPVHQSGLRPHFKRACKCCLYAGVPSRVVWNVLRYALLERDGMMGPMEKVRAILKTGEVERLKHRKKW